MRSKEKKKKKGKTKQSTQKTIPKTMREAKPNADMCVLGLSAWGERRAFLRTRARTPGGSAGCQQFFGEGADNALKLINTVVVLAHLHFEPGESGMRGAFRNGGEWAASQGCHDGARACWQRADGRRVRLRVSRRRLFRWFRWRWYGHGRGRGRGCCVARGRCNGGG